MIRDKLTRAVCDTLATRLPHDAYIIEITNTRPPFGRSYVRITYRCGFDIAQSRCLYRRSAKQLDALANVIRECCELITVPYGRGYLSYRQRL